jgi:F0F1-type ATP synthase membrane subunit c/vacuolar-type H+-ATPase subunit K
MNPEPVTTPVAPPIKSTRILVSTLGSALVFFGIVLYLEIPGSGYPPIWVPWTLGALAVISHLLSRTLGFRVRPIPASTLPSDAMPAALAAFQSSLILRFALSEGIAIIAMVLSFVLATWMTYLIGGVLALILFVVNVWPSTANISKVQQQLDREGGQSYLADALLGLAPGTAASAVIRT